MNYFDTKGSIMPSTEDVLNHHLASLGAEDIEAVMEDYTEDSVILTPPRPHLRACGNSPFV